MGVVEALVWQSRSLWLDIAVVSSLDADVLVVYIASIRLAHTDWLSN